MVLVVVDGYNFIRQVGRFSRVEMEKGLGSAREFLLDELEGFGERSGCCIKVVFDGRNNSDGLYEERFAGVDVVFSSEKMKADDVIVELVERNVDVECDVVVVSADIGLRNKVVLKRAFVVKPVRFDEVLLGRRPFVY